MANVPPRQPIAGRAKPVLARLKWLASNYKKHILPHLAVALFVASTLAALEVLQPQWLKVTNTAAIRLVLWVDDGLDRIAMPHAIRERWPAWLPEWLKDARPFHSTLTESLLKERTTEDPPTVTLVSLTPAAYSHFLSRTSPVPRGRLACVLYALSERLRQPKREPSKYPVVAIDIDVSPVEVSAIEGVSELWAGCESEIKNVGGEHADAIDRNARRGSLTAEQAMRRALQDLASHTRVVAVNYPRTTPEARRKRNAFIGEVCCRPPAAALSSSELTLKGWPACANFSSPHLLYSAQDLVYEYATTLRTPGPTASQASRNASQTALPQSFPGLGQAISQLLAERSTKARPLAALGMYEYCVRNPGGSRSLLDDELLRGDVAASIINAYEYRPIALGPARSSISYFDVDHDDSSDPDFWQEIKRRLQNLPDTDIYILTIDSGTTEDKFYVPGSDAPVPGAWLHGAIAVTESINLRRTEEGTSASIRHSFAGKVAIDVLKGLGFALVVGAFMRMFVRRTNPVLHDLGIVLAPLVVGIVFLYLEAVWFLAPDLATYKSSPSMLLLTGMTLDVYLDARSNRWQAVRQKKLGPSARRWQWAGQWVWASVIVVSALIATLERPPTLYWLIAIGAGIGILYAKVARVFRALPLPWSANSLRRRR